MKESSHSFETQSQHCMIASYQPQLHQMLQNMVWVQSLSSKQADGDWRSVAFASRSLTATERRYAPFKKESLGVTCACEHFGKYILGMTFQVETDYKPLISLLGYRCLDKLSSGELMKGEKFICPL